MRSYSTYTLHSKKKKEIYYKKRIVCTRQLIRYKNTRQQILHLNIVHSITTLNRVRTRY